MSEAFFDLTQKCVIPKIGYLDGANEAMQTMHLSPKERLRQSTISCRTAVPKGSVFIFSFHVSAKDRIKCYLFRDAQCIRFLPQDIKLILPHLFNLDSNRRNAEFVQNDTLVDDLIPRLNYTDKLFDSWFNNRAKSA